jgi:5-formyltetrahydrofolate cyclo-ligase
MPKKSLRRAMLDRRSALSSGEWLSLSSDVQHRFLESELFVGSAVIALYAPVKREVDTSTVMSAALSAGKTVLFPVVAGGALLFRKITGEHDLVVGTFGIAEPQPGCPERQPDEAACIVVPGVAFDCCGRRIGYGKGYYDRTLHRLEGTGRLVGFGFDFQLVDEIVGEPHDVALDLIITERRFLPVRSPYKGGKCSED